MYVTLSETELNIYTSKSASLPVFSVSQGNDITVNSVAQGKSLEVFLDTSYSLLMPHVQVHMPQFWWI